VKNHKEPKSGGYAFPVDTIRQYLGLPVSENEFSTAPQPPRIKSKPIPPKPAPKPLGRLIDKKVKFLAGCFDGSMPFDAWLHQPTTTFSMLIQFDQILRTPSSRRNAFLKKTGIPDTDFQRGVLTGMISAAIPHIRMQDMLHKYKSHQYSCMGEYIVDEKWILSFFLLNKEPIGSQHPIIDTMQHCRHVEEFRKKLIAHYFAITNEHRQQKLFDGRLRSYISTQWHHELNRHHLSNEFHAGYSIGVLKELNLINPAEDPYWFHPSTSKDLIKLCTFYTNIVSWDQAFVKKYFPVSILRFSYKVKSDFRRLHTLFVKTLIYKSAMANIPFANVLEDIESYRQSAGIQIRLNATQVEKVYTVLPIKTELWCHYELSNLINIPISSRAED